jgi:hypothetical protein
MPQEKRAAREQIYVDEQINAIIVIRLVSTVVGK